MLKVDEKTPCPICGEEKLSLQGVEQLDVSGEGGNVKAPFRVWKCGGDKCVNTRVYYPVTDAGLTTAVEEA